MKFQQSRSAAGSIAKEAGTGVDRLGERGEFATMPRRASMIILAPHCSSTVNGTQTQSDPGHMHGWAEISTGIVH